MEGLGRTSRNWGREGSREGGRYGGSREEAEGRGRGGICGGSGQRLKYINQEQSCITNSSRPMSPLDPGRDAQDATKSEGEMGG